jgi:heme/copper-type cytochrome/quinol oxidase subunit 4
MDFVTWVVELGNPFSLSLSLSLSVCLRAIQTIVHFLCMLSTVTCHGLSEPMMVPTIVVVVVVVHGSLFFHTKEPTDIIKRLGINLELVCGFL